MENVQESNNPEPPPFQFSLRTLLIGVTIFCVLLGLLVPVIRSAKEATELEQQHRNFKKLSLGMQSNCSARLRLFAANGVDSSGKAIHRWRFQLVPYFERLPTYPPAVEVNWDPSVHWDDPMHSRLRKYPGFFCRFSGVDKTAPSETRTVAITGPGTAFEDGKTYKLEELPNDLIIIVETRNSGFHWMEPGDLDIRTMPRTIDAADGRGIAANIGDRFHVIFADGSVWQLSTDVPFEEIEKFLTIDGAKRYDRDEVLGDYATWR
ncbi:MAG: type II secretion system protein [Pirellulales bacterium]|nr:type II secretion system protein [Pirellulales bacterium]